MRYAPALAALILLAAASLPAAAAGDLTGKWTLEGDVQGNPVNMACAIKQDSGAKITGKCTVNGKDSVEIAGEVKESKITFEFTAQGYLLHYVGKIDGDTMKGDIEVAGTTGTFSGKRDTN